MAVERGRSHELVGSMVGAVYVHVLRTLSIGNKVRDLYFVTLLVAESGRSVTLNPLSPQDRAE